MQLKPEVGRAFFTNPFSFGPAAPFPRKHSSFYVPDCSLMYRTVRSRTQPFQETPRTFRFLRKSLETRRKETYVPPRKVWRNALRRFCSTALPWWSRATPGILIKTFFGEVERPKERDNSHEKPLAEGCTFRFKFA